MERKLIKQGGGGYTIYLPKEWVKGKGLKEGDAVQLEERNTSLVIQTHAKLKSEYKITVDKSNRNDLKVLLTHAYRNGFDSIKLEGLDENLHKEIKEIVGSLLLGFEITKKDSKIALIENISEPTDQKFDIMMKRLFFITDETIKILIEDSSSNKWKRFKEISEMRDNHDRFLLFCRRIITKQYIETNSMLMWELLTYLQNIQHSHYYLYQYLEKSKPKLSKETLSLLKDIKEYFELFSKSYFDRDLSAIHSINEKRKKYQFGACLTAIEKSEGKEAIVNSYVREIYRLIQLGTSPILLYLFDQY